MHTPPPFIANCTVFCDRNFPQLPAWFVVPRRLAQLSALVEFAQHVVEVLLCKFRPDAGESIVQNFPRIVRSLVCIVLDVLFNPAECLCARRGSQQVRSTGAIAATVSATAAQVA